MHKLHKRTIVLLYGCWLTVVCGAWAGAGLWASQHHSGSSLTRSDTRARGYLRFVPFVQPNYTATGERCVLAVRVSTIRSVRSERFLPGSACARGILPHCTRVDDDNTDATQMPGGLGQRQCGLSAQLDVTFHVSTPPGRLSSASLRSLCSSLSIAHLSRSAPSQR